MADLLEQIDMSNGTRTCLGYEGHECDADLTGADHRVRRCRPCHKEHRRIYNRDYGKAARARPRPCLGYPGYECDVDLAGTNGAKLRCAECYVKNHRQTQHERYLSRRPDPVRQFRDASQTVLSCAHCHRALPAEAFNWAEQGVRRHSLCRDCAKEKKQAWRAANPDKVRAEGDRRNRKMRERTRGMSLEERLARSLRTSARKLGFDPDQVEAHYQNHNGLCDICRRAPQEVNKLRNRLCIDHDHQTGAFRGLLCTDCNLWIGLAQDDTKLMLAAVDYLERAAAA